MQKIDITHDILTEGTRFISGTPVDATLCLSKKGSGLMLPQLIKCKERYLTFFIELLEDHSIPMNLLFYSRKESREKPAFNIRFGIMPGIRALICIDIHWLDARILFPENNEGQLKVVCHGRRVDPDEIDYVTLANYPCFHDIHVRISELTLTDISPDVYPIPDVKLIDEFGQYKMKEWPGKIRSIDELRDRLWHMDKTLQDAYPFPDWNSFGGWKTKKLTEGTGFFTKIKAEGRWWLVDPSGCAFFSMGSDCTVVRPDCRVDGIEKFMDWLPDENDPVYGGMYGEWRGRPSEVRRRRRCKLFSFEQANLYRVFGEDWHSKWSSIIVRQLKQSGINTLGNWSDRKLHGKVDMPYVTMLPDFPTTTTKIFRDFPDVFSEEFRTNAVRAARALRDGRDDPYMVGYFLCNEPAWAFVDDLVIADEVLYNPARTACRERLIGWLKEKYGSVEALNKAWESDFTAFEDLYAPLRQVSRWSAGANMDMREFSRIMMEAYVKIPSDACRAEDPNHMNLGLRWAWISNPDMVAGWQHIDVFSINCYALDPSQALDNIQNLKMDLPVLIGEFHFGALDRGPTATGLEGVMTQKDRGLAYRYYCEHAAAHPLCVGCHYFQCYDQFALGRFDGENYNIGLFDICSQPYGEMLDCVRECCGGVYKIAAGLIEPVRMKPHIIPMIAY